MSQTDAYAPQPGILHRVLLRVYPIMHPHTAARPIASGARQAPVFLLALLLPPLIAIALVARAATPSSNVPTRAIGPAATRAPAAAPVINPCCVHWQRTALTAESDALLANPWQPSTV